MQPVNSGLGFLSPTHVDVKHNSDGTKTYSFNNNGLWLRLNIFNTAMSIAFMAIGVFTSTPEIFAFGALCALVAVPLMLYGFWQRSQSTTIPIDVFHKITQKSF